VVGGWLSEILAILFLLDILEELETCFVSLRTMLCRLSENQRFSSGR